LAEHIKEAYTCTCHRTAEALPQNNSATNGRLDLSRKRKPRRVRVNDFKYRLTDQPNGWLGATVKVDWPILTNLRLDPYERSGMFNGRDNSSISYYNWFVNEFWRFVLVQQVVGKLAQTAIDFPPMQPGASFNLEAIKAQIQKAISAKTGD
jgi:hypothetical protein